MTFSSSGLSHVAIRVSDLERSAGFYRDLLGFEAVFEGDDVIVFKVGGQLLGVRGGAAETPSGDRFDPYRIGLDHLAFAAESAEKLDAMQEALDAAGVRHEGVQPDSTFNATALVFYDPDGIALEMYAPARSE